MNISRGIWPAVVNMVNIPGGTNQLRRIKTKAYFGEHNVTDINKRDKSGISAYSRNKKKKKKKLHK